MTGPDQREPTYATDAQVEAATLRAMKRWRGLLDRLAPNDGGEPEHDHAAPVEGCYRCDLSRHEAERSEAEERALIVGVLSEHRLIQLGRGRLPGCLECGRMGGGTYAEHVAALILEALAGGK